MSADIASDPGALPDDRIFIAYTDPETVGGSSSSGLHSTCGSLLIASILIDDGRLRTPSKCSAHRCKIASLSVRRLVLSALIVVVPELWELYINCLECIKELSHILSVFKGLDFISLFAQPKVVHVSEPSLYSLTFV